MEAEKSKALAEGAGRRRSRFVLEESKRLAASVAGAFLYALGVNMFVVPSGLYSGGLMGLCQIVRTLLVDYAHIDTGGLDIAGILYYALNVPILIIAWFSIDRKFIVRTLINISFMTVFLSLIPIENLLGGDNITSCLVGGVIAGIGTGLTLWAGSCGGGMDVVSVMIIQKKSNFSIGRISLYVNVVLYLCCLILFDVQTAIYSIVYSVLYSFALDKLHLQNINVEVIIITKQQTKTLGDAIINELRRGVTKIQAEGEFTGEPESMLYVVISKFEIHQLKAIVKKHDPHAFVTIKEHADVYGNYLKKL